MQNSAIQANFNSYTVAVFCNSYTVAVFSSRGRRDARS